MRSELHGDASKTVSEAIRVNQTVNPQPELTCWLPTCRDPLDE
jgi:hypothetical protein